MKTINFVIFFAVFFTIYGLVNWYIFARGAQVLPQGSLMRSVYLFAFPVIALSFVAGRFLERVWLSPVSNLLVWLGSLWLGAMVYFFLAVLLLDLLRFFHHFVPFYPSRVTRDYDSAKQWIALGVSGLVLLILVAGHINSRIPRLRTISFAIPKRVDGLRSLSIVALSDIHLGTIIGRSRLTRMVERINALGADLVLLPGDIVDEDLGPVVRNNLGEMLEGIRSKYGTVGITGNHEHIGGVQEACDYLAEHGVTMLRDEVLRLDCGVFLVGREDLSGRQFGGRQRRPLRELMASVDPGSPTILLDHQPFRLEEAALNGVDIQLSGHTHHGQLWPFQYITQALFEISYGYKQVGSTRVVVSSGIGTWGPPVRTSSRPEILHLTLTFE